ncbi:xylose isomerase [Fadolivirus algeromassiliense]|jgi:sugar phosphate isomerase/epimerase|uniref:Xylose isomerase n=1 Tax=Fadolivirus FV1/VV64 TaxID=3070911 RepID=A0A7D3V5Z3_9VIRU|nr:xylose isomerase [Fadolivirus algeromassiliense]QKF94572.1 xylose isomerase [Fadolivirus FV1/VV64]
MNKFSKTALIGYTGFVGSNLFYDYHFTDIYNSKNINDIINKEYDCIVCCGIVAKKWYANLYPDEDQNLINELLNKLKYVKTKKFILISTIDIYDSIDALLDEDYIPDINYNNHAYGKHRLYVETFVKTTFTDYHIIRLPGLFGFGLRKNVIFDYLNGSLKELNLNSSFQWYYLGDLFNDINLIINDQIKIVNLFTEPITNKELLDVFVKYSPNLTINYITTNQINYNMLTKYVSAGYYYNKNNILIKLDKYINVMKCNKMIISNLSWKHNNNLEMLQKLNDYGIRQLEIAPYKYFGDKITNIDINLITKEFDIYSFQAIIYPLTENIFNSKEERNNIKQYLFKVINVAKKLGVKILVFGSPKNRQRNNISYNEALNIATYFFREIGDYAHNNNVILCIEPNAKIYNCDFITNSIEGRELVLKINSKGFRLHLDVGCMMLENEDIIDSITNNLDILEHIHFSAPQLKCLLDNNDINYNELFNKINKIYHKNIAIEMLNQNDYDVIRTVRNCLI